MDIRKLLSIASSIPKEKLKTDAGLREVIKELGRKTGRTFTENELNSYVSKFKSMARTENTSSLLNQLSKKGMTQNDLNEIKKRFK
ncbi:hypothetical protein ACQCN2_22000 [Brevibacillus ginsengisoli]|uniref:hypothetical protein n=1 Tax=Brevibacillus ginsengisoli TaxID=363854 RepID=UPI003CEC9798